MSMPLRFFNLDGSEQPDGAAIPQSCHATVRDRRGVAVS